MNAANVVVSEENVPFVKIVFPAVPNRKWDGNALNSLQAGENVLTETGKSYELASGVTTVGEYIRIVQEDSYDPIIYLDKRQELYVRNNRVDSARRYSIWSTAQMLMIVKFGQQVINNGTIYVQTLIEYGQN